MDFLTRFFQWLLGYGRVQEPPHGGQSLGTAALGVARSEIGRGEDGGNNIGSDLARYRFLSRVGRPGGPWCAVFVSFCLIKAADQLGRTAIGASASAKRLFKLAIKGGGVRVAEPRAGDLVLWHRGARNSRKGHIGIVSRIHDDGSFSSVEGNKGTYPSRVGEFRHQVGESLLLGFCRLP